MYISLSDHPKDPVPDDEASNGAVRVPQKPGTGARVSSVVVALGVVSLLTDISSESVSAMLPLYITGVIGLSTIAFGFIDGIYQGVSALVRIAGGWAADRGDQPKWIAFFGYAVSADRQDRPAVRHELRRDHRGARRRPARQGRAHRTPRRSRGRLLAPRRTSGVPSACTGCWTRSAPRWGR